MMDVVEAAVGVIVMMDAGVAVLMRVVVVTMLMGVNCARLLSPLYRLR